MHCDVTGYCHKHPMWKLLWVLVLHSRASGGWKQCNMAQVLGILCSSGRCERGFWLPASDQSTCVLCPHLWEWTSNGRPFLSVSFLLSLFIWETQRKRRRDWERNMLICFLSAQNSYVRARLKPEGREWQEPEIVGLLPHFPGVSAEAVLEAV